MKLLYLTIFIFILNCGYSQAKFKFDHRTHRFPKTKEGVQLEHEYKFTNKGNRPLLIDSVSAECSCTSVVYPEKPVLPGESGIIHVTFDTNKKYSWQDRIIEIHSNVLKSPTNIRFKVMVDNKK